MQGRVSIRVNGERLVVRGESNVYEAIQDQRNWQDVSGEGLVGLVSEAKLGQPKKGVSDLGKRPHYCYKEGRRGVSATCRMCRVEREGGMKPVPSCARPVVTGMSVWTETPRVQKVREGVRERRLRNHPLDCPICDQGGECDLQEQTEEFGSESSRMRERKRGVEDKESACMEITSFVGEEKLGQDSLGQVKIVMTRCIHCTRCVRYGKQVANRGRGIRGRGKEAEVGRYTPTGSRQTVRAGNRVDRCPVGARTAEGGKFKVRPWERKEVERVDRMDSVGVPRKVKYTGSLTRGGERKAVRVKPERGERGERLGDKSRYGYDGRENGRRRDRRVSSGPKSQSVKSATQAGQGRRKKGSVRSAAGVGSERSYAQGMRRARNETNVPEVVAVDERWDAVGVEVARDTQIATEIKRMQLLGRKRVVGTGVDRDRREERKRGERRGEWEREGLGVGKRAERRRHAGETACDIRGSDTRNLKRLTRGRDRGKERPVVGRKRGRAIIGEASSVRAKEWQIGLGGGEEPKLGVGRVKRKGMVERESAEGSVLMRERMESGKGQVRLGAGRWGRSDGSGWLKRHGKRRKGMEESGKVRGVSRMQHRSNTQGRRNLGLSK